MQHVLTAPDAVRNGPGVGDGRAGDRNWRPVVVFTPHRRRRRRRRCRRTRPRPGTCRPPRKSIAGICSTLDEGRPTAITKRHNQNRRTARENIADLVDPGSFVEYGALTVAWARSAGRRSEDDLIATHPGRRIGRGGGENRWRREPP